MLDLGITNSLFTWIGTDGKCSELDRFLLSESWFIYGQWKVNSLGRQLSDHKAIYLQTDHTNWGPRPFKSYNWWLGEEEVKITLNNFWNLILMAKRIFMLF